MRDGLKTIGHSHLPFRFQLGYWANFIHPDPLDPNQSDPDHPLYVEDPYSRSGQIKRGKEKKFQKKIRDYIEQQIDKLLLNEDLTINFSAISDFIIHHFFHDLEVYYTANVPGKKLSDYQAREAIRHQLATVLKQHRHQQILLIAHSMGSIIAYDVLTRVVPEIEIDTFVTCGSPLGIPVIMGKIRAEQKMDNPRTPLTVPENIRRIWYNLSDLHDRVAINYNLADDYIQNSKGIAIRDIQVANTYEYQGIINPHKSYGYLRTPEMAEIIHEFLTWDISGFRIWIMEKIYTVRHLFKKS